MGPPTRRLGDDELKQRNAQKAEAELAALEKDEVELRLEKMLFGDEAGFMDSLTASTGRTETALARIGGHERSDVSEDEDEDRDMADVPDDELFFLDAGTGQLPQEIARELPDEDRDMDYQKRQPVWVDSDDERMTVSLASNTRLRKLRDTEDDDIVSGTEYIRRLRRQYERLHPTPEWVKYAYKKRRLSNDKDGSESDSDISIDDQPLLASVQPLSELLRTAGGFTRTETTPANGQRQRKLRPEVIDIQRVKDVVSSGPSSIDTMQFHPYFPLLLSGGPSSTVNLYHISPQPPNPNPMVTSLHLKNTPLHTAAFCRPTENSSESHDQDGTRIFMSSRRRFFHTWSLSTGKVQKVARPMYGTAKSDQKTMENFKLSPCGRYMGLEGSGRKGGGTVNVLNTETMQWVCTCRIESRGGVADFSWWRDGNGFAVVGKNGEVSDYDIEQKKVVCRWQDEGGVGITVIALGGEMAQKGLGGSRWVAVGSSSGIVNIYDRQQWTDGPNENMKVPRNPKPVRTFDQLTTPTSHLEFADDGQMMVMGSRWKRDAIRLVHLPSCTVYRNWPTDKTPLGRISSVALSVDGGYLAVANDQGKIRLFQIRD